MSHFTYRIFRRLIDEAMNRPGMRAGLPSVQVDCSQLESLIRYAEHLERKLEEEKRQNA